MGEAQIVAFLNHLAMARAIAASTQNQALNALVFLYKRIRAPASAALENLTPAERPTRLPTVFDRSEIQQFFQHLEGTAELVAALLYRLGLRLIEGLRLRISGYRIRARSIRFVPR